MFLSFPPLKFSGFQWISFFSAIIFQVRKWSFCFSFPNSNMSTLTWELFFVKKYFAWQILTTTCFHSCFLFSGYLSLLDALACDMGGTCEQWVTPVGILFFYSYFCPVVLISVLVHDHLSSVPGCAAPPLSFSPPHPPFTLQAHPPTICHFHSLPKAPFTQNKIVMQNGGKYYTFSTTGGWYNLNVTWNKPWTQSFGRWGHYYRQVHAKPGSSFPYWKSWCSIGSAHQVYW